MNNIVGRKECGMLTFMWHKIQRLGRCNVTKIRLHLKYVQFWSLHNRKDVVVLQRVQKRFNTMLPGLEEFSYKETLDRLGMFCPDQASQRDNLIEVYIRDIVKIFSPWYGYQKQESISLR